MAEVRTTFTSDDKEVQKSLTAMQKQLQALVEENRKLKTAGKEAGEALETAFDGLRDLAGTVTGIGGATAAVTALSQAFQELERHQKAARDAQLDAASPERAFMLNMIPKSEQEASAARERITSIARETNLSRADIYRIATPAVSATTSQEQLWAAVKLAAQVRPDDIGEAQAVAGGLGDIAKLTGSDNMNANFGLMAKMAGQARVDNLRSVAANLIPGAIGVKARGGTSNDAAALVTALTKSGADATGAQTGTAAIQLANQLADALPKLGSTDERIAFMVANAKEREKFIGKASFEQKAKAPVADLLRGGAGYRLYQEHKAGASTEAELQGMGLDALRAINTLPLQQTAELERTGKNANVRTDEAKLATGKGISLQENVREMRAKLGGPDAWIDWGFSWVPGLDTADRATFGDKRWAQTQLKGIESQLGTNKMLGMSPSEDTLKELEKITAELKAIANNTDQKQQNRRGLNIDGNAEGK